MAALRSVDPCQAQPQPEWFQQPVQSDLRRVVPGVNRPRTFGLAIRTFPANPTPIARIPCERDLDRHARFLAAGETRARIPAEILSQPFVPSRCAVPIAHLTSNAQGQILNDNLREATGDGNSTARLTGCLIHTNLRFLHIGAPCGPTSISTPT